MEFTEKHRETVEAYLNLEPFTGRDRSRCVALRALMASHHNRNIECQKLKAEVERRREERDAEWVRAVREHMVTSVTHEMGDEILRRMGVDATSAKPCKVRSDA